jgi:DNA-binding transcriptional MerR regulator
MTNAAEHETDAKRSRKSPTAFRTISEVAGELDVPQHVLRFWESKFSQVKPLKRGGGRRYYRPEDVALLERIRSLLYNDGYTIKGVQKVLRDAGGRKNAPASTEDAAAENTAATNASGAAHEAPVGALQKRELNAIVEELEVLRDLLTRRKR